MVVQHNLQAMNANRMLNVNTKTQAKSTEKLSSGYKINRAADDAAGLSISEKMRKQIRGLSQASLNAQDGISAVQTAEGALNEVQDMLQRMNELAVKAANGTNSEDDRSYIQDEIEQLLTEIDRVAETTKFNESYMLKGDNTKTSTTFGYLDSYKKVTGSDGKSDVNLYDICGNTVTSEMALEMQKNGEKIYKTRATNTAATTSDVGLATVAVCDLYDKEGHKIANKGDIITSEVAAATWYKDATGATTAEIKGTGVGAAITVTNKTLYKADGTVAVASGASIKDEDVAKYYSSVALGTEAVKGSDYKVKEYGRLYDKDGNGVATNALDSYFELDKDGNKVYKGGLYDSEGNAIGTKGKELFEDKDLSEHFTSKTLTKGALEFNLHVGADATDNNQISLKIEAMDTTTLGIEGIKVDGTDDSNALSAIENIKAALQKVSTQRSALGAVQNRLEHTINNLDNVVENTTSAESQIRDTDMASEMVKYSNNNILAQAGQAMLAQANQSNQGVLSLLG